jgi:ATP-dependent Clp protease adaptor protein ClpS
MPPDDPKFDSAPQTGTTAVAEPAVQVKKPQLYKVLLHNDDYTTMEFVVMILMTVFHHDEPSSVSVMLQVHQKGVGVAGVYSFEMAESRISKVTRLAKENEFPLRCSMEPD